MAVSLRSITAFIVALFVFAGASAAQPFTYTQIDLNFDAINYGMIAFADVDRDGDFDLLASGNRSTTTPFVPTTLLARASGEAPLTLWNTVAPALWHSTGAWADFNRDGHLDFAMAGTVNETVPYNGMARLFQGNGTGTFTAVDLGLEGVYSGSVAWGDYDNDGDPDLALSGMTAEIPVTRLYRNDGGSFAPVEGPFRQVAFSDLAWGDYDNDGDLDLALSGAEETGTFATRLYRNDGGTFVDANAGLRNLAYSSLAWGDYDGDGDLDLALAGGELSLRDFMRGAIELYRNDGGTFNRVDAGFNGVFYGQLAWGDYDNDGDLDLLVLGATQLIGARIGEVYRNEGGTFERSAIVPGLMAGEASWGDYDGDSDLDLVAAGQDVTTLPFTRLFRNEQRIINTAPTAPDGLQAGVEGNSVTLLWNAASDETTPANALTYNLRVGTAAGARDIVPPLADPATGYRLVPGPGNTGLGTGHTLRGLPRGTYYWSVQSVDNSFIGSPFAAEGTFTITSNAEVDTGTDEDAGPPERFALYPGYPNPFQTSTTLEYDLPEPAPVVVTVYNTLGSEVARLVDGRQAAGRQQVVWDGRDRSGQQQGAGIYFVRMQVGSKVWSQTLVLVK